MPPWGALPGAKSPTESDEQEGTGNGDGYWFDRRVWPLMEYWLRHPHSTLRWGRYPNFTERGALHRGFKWLLSVYNIDAIQTAIDRFWMTTTAHYHPKPWFAFLSKDFQNNVLFTGADVSASGVMQFIADGFERNGYDQWDLPWQEEYDFDIGLEFITNEHLLVLARTYPDVVATILVNFQNDEKWIDELQTAWEHYEYLMGLRPSSPRRMRTLVKEVKLPDDFRTRRPGIRSTQPSLEEAVRASSKRFDVFAKDRES